MWPNKIFTIPQALQGSKWKKKVLSFPSESINSKNLIRYYSPPIS